MTRALVMTALIGLTAAYHPKFGYLTPPSALRYAQTNARERTGTSEPAELVLKAELSEWKITLDEQSVASGRVVFKVHNAGTMAHRLEVEGNGIEKRTPDIAPDSTRTLTLDLRAGKYEVYCPLGSGQHKKMGMETHLTVHAAK